MTPRTKRISVGSAALARMRDMATAGVPTDSVPIIEKWQADWNANLVLLRRSSEVREAQSLLRLAFRGLIFDVAAPLGETMQ